MTDLSDLDVNQLLAEFLDRCRNRDGNFAFNAIDELRTRIWASGVLPFDPRQRPEELVTARERITETERLRAENKRLLAASLALAQCRDTLRLTVSRLEYMVRNGSTIAKFLAQDIKPAIDAADAALK